MTTERRIQEIAEQVGCTVEQVREVIEFEAAQRSINPLTGKSADCQWSRHILCLAPATCGCTCHGTKS